LAADESASTSTRAQYGNIGHLVERVVRIFAFFTFESVQLASSLSPTRPTFIPPAQCSDFFFLSDFYFLTDLYTAQTGINTYTSISLPCLLTRRIQGQHLPWCINLSTDLFSVKISDLRVVFDFFNSLLLCSLTQPPVASSSNSRHLRRVSQILPILFLSLFMYCSVDLSHLDLWFHHVRSRCRNSPAYTPRMNVDAVMHA
jgi:hypothetical protein